MKIKHIKHTLRQLIEDGGYANERMTAGEGRADQLTHRVDDLTGDVRRLGRTAAAAAQGAVADGLRELGDRIIALETAATASPAGDPPLVTTHGADLGETVTGPARWAVFSDGRISVTEVNGTRRQVLALDREAAVKLLTLLAHAFGTVIA
jgi:hypothetical protein